jgi:hypothetical protein
LLFRPSLFVENCEDVQASGRTSIRGALQMWERGIRQFILAACDYCPNQVPWRSDSHGSTTKLAKWKEAGSFAATACLRAWGNVVLLRLRILKKIRNASEDECRKLLLQRASNPNPKFCVGDACSAVIEQFWTHNLSIEKLRFLFQRGKGRYKNERTNVLPRDIYCTKA